MKIIPHLQKGDSVALISPAKAIDNELILNAKSLWEKEGYSVLIGKNASQKEFYFAGKIEQRVADFNEALNNKEIKAIVCTRGGYGCIQLLDLIDWTLFETNPKWIIGFSDITVLHLKLQQMNFPSIHATMPLNYSENNKASLHSLFESVRGINLNYTIKASKFNIQGEAEGVLIGGNLSILYSMLYSFDNDFFKNKILIIEEIGEYLYHIDRMFYSLKNKGVFQLINGLIIGGFTELKDTNPPFGIHLEKMLVNHLQPFKIPIVFHFNFGHLNDNRALVLGKKTKLRSLKNEVEISQF
ncbi:MAG: LD-carboxypeptidase [Flavobacteriia bacterium]|nr:LD-carboxypeptidase [Flavobacteriia bacterium]